MAAHLKGIAVVPWCCSAHGSSPCAFPCSLHCHCPHRRCARPAHSCVPCRCACPSRGCSILFILVLLVVVFFVVVLVVIVLVLLAVVHCVLCRCGRVCRWGGGAKG